MSTILKTHNAPINIRNGSYLKDNWQKHDTNNFSFHIKIYENIDHIEVFAKYLQGFLYLTKNHVECITFQDFIFYQNINF